MSFNHKNCPPVGVTDSWERLELTYLEIRKPGGYSGYQNHFSEIDLESRDINNHILGLLYISERRSVLISDYRLHRYSLLAAILDAQLTEIIRKLCRKRPADWSPGGQLGIANQ